MIHQANGGVSAARNAGLERATGEAVAFPDGDDAFDPAFVKALLSAMLREQADLALCKYTVHRTDGPLPRTGREKTRPYIWPRVCGHIDALHTPVEGAVNSNVWNRLNGLILRYIQSLQLVGHESREVKKELRRQIIAAGRQIGIKTCCRKTRAAYYMIRYCPWALWIVHPLHLLLLRPGGGPTAN